MFAAAPTLARRAAAGATASGVSPDGSRTTKSAVTAFSKAPENDAWKPLTKIATNATSATPTISAAAVPAVRPGARTALPRAIFAATPPVAASGRPISAASGPTSSGDSSPTPTNTMTAPTPSSVSAGDVSRPPSSPTSMTTRPIAAIPTCSASTQRRLALDEPSEPSRIAAMGEIRVARTAGARLDSSVTTVPRTIATAIVRPATTSAVRGRSKPISPSRPASSGASPIPAKRPSTDPTSPIRSASWTTACRIWRRDAPIVRSMPNSRVRCATVIVNVLKMTNEPTSRAMRPKTSSPILR